MATPIGVTKTLEVIKALQDVAVKGVGLVKSKSLLSVLMAAPSLMSDFGVVMADVTGVLPELESLNAAEVGQLGTAAYAAVSAVVQAVVA